MDTKWGQCAHNLLFTAVSVRVQGASACGFITAAVCVSTGDRGFGPGLDGGLPPPPAEVMPDGLTVRCPL